MLHFHSTARNARVIGPHWPPSDTLRPKYDKGGVLSGICLSTSLEGERRQDVILAALRSSCLHLMAGYSVSKQARRVPP